jgi:hypothetical protein
MLSTFFKHPVVAAVMVATVVLVSGGCGDDDSDAAPAASSDQASEAVDVSDVEVSLFQGGIVAPAKLDAGTLTLAVKNDGSQNHQLTIVAAESYESLPLRDNGSVKIEELDPLLVAVATEPLFAGFPAEPFTVDLEPGTYVFFCNLQSVSGDNSHIVAFGQRLEVAVG